MEAWSYNTLARNTEKMLGNWRCNSWKETSMFFSQGTDKMAIGENLLKAIIL